MKFFSPCMVAFVLVVSFCTNKSLAQEFNDKSAMIKSIHHVNKQELNKTSVIPSTSNPKMNILSTFDNTISRTISPGETLKVEDVYIGSGQPLATYDETILEIPDFISHSTDEVYREYSTFDYIGSEYVSFTLTAGTDAVIGTYPVRVSYEFYIGESVSATYLLTINLTVENSGVSNKPFSALPEKYQLSQNYPNPFNPTTTISYEIPRADHVKLLVLNLEGRTVLELINQYQPAGQYSILWNAGSLPSGIYFIRLETNGFVSTKKCVFNK